LRWGPRRRRLAGQLLAEGCALALLGGAGGLAVASGLLDGIRRLAPGSMPRIEAIQLDVRAVFFALAATGLTVLLFALLPAWSASRHAVAAGLQRASRGGGGESAGPLHGMILLQTALCVVLLVAAGLLGGSYLRLSRIDPGFSAQRVLSFTVSLPRGAYREPAVRTAFLDRLIESVRALPGVGAAGLVGWLPGKGSMTVSFSAEGHPRLSRAQSPQGEIRGVSPGTFEALRIPILEGRGVTANDRSDSPPVIVLNRQLASRLWPGRSAIGRHVTIFADKREREVVGVVGDIRRLDRAGVTPDQMWVPSAQDPIWIRTSAVVRSAGDPTALIASIEGAARRLDPGVALSDIQTMGQVLSGSVAEPRFRTILIGFFAAAALALASIGLYGVIAYTVARRRYEIGVRIALGATPREILRLFVGRGIRLAGIGAVAGILCALAVTRLLAGLLYGVRPSDPITFAGATALLLGVAFLASLLPARRAASTDPLTALRSD
jgi:putative ABC transport system permease protein